MNRKNQSPKKQNERKNNGVRKIKIKTSVETV